MDVPILQAGRKHYICTKIIALSRILAIDYGKKRCGLAVSDPLKIIAGALDTVPTAALFDYISKYIAAEDVDTLVVGLPRQTNGEDSETMKYIRPFVGRFRKAHPGIRLEMVDERFTTKLAFRAMLDAGLKKSDRNNKNGIVDKVSATIILQTYMESLRQ